MPQQPTRPLNGRTPSTTRSAPSPQDLRGLPRLPDPVPSALALPAAARSARRAPAVSRLARSAALAGGLAVLPLTTGCAAGESEPAGGKRQSATAAPVVSALEAQVVAPAKVEVIAGLTGCEVKIRTEAAELREGVCHTADGDYLITTFPEERFKETWLDTIGMYQGTYLVGSRWVVSAQPKALEEFRGTLGGTIVHLSGMGPSAAPSP
ncbi:hypothetical protein ABTX35_27615 [Streptomyces sp. NPDC096080]|uniref:hypothetical protein n=1 Tax=Streptomyces sp. NPDC096080 TaxID=3156693 RepID=UPI00331D8772